MALILIIDDDDDVVKTIASSLTRHGYSVVYANTGVEAMEILSCQRVDLVLLDIALPLMDGIQVCQQIRANPQTATLPILFTTVSADIQSKTAAYDAGADDYMVKPFDLQELDLRIKALLLRDKSMAGAQ